MNNYSRNIVLEEGYTISQGKRMMGRVSAGTQRVSTNLIRAVDEEDDWTGLTDGAARRKRQNRLNVRAYHSRIPVWVEDEQEIIFLPAPMFHELNVKRPPLLHHVSIAQIPAMLDRSTAARVMFPLSSDHLITLLQYNVLRASIANRMLFSSCYSTSPVAECSTAALHVLPSLPIPDNLPPSLYPTALQCKIPHEEWLDIVPHPIWRDNVLLALGTFDEDEVWADTIGGLFEGFPHSDVERRGIIAWSPPWHVTGWEISEGFLRKWGWMFKGCEDILEATNKWREKRGEHPLKLDCV
ncbi:hypothetical protein NA57DRAFT_64798 [Rhizodiscina lignyota]|uniref:Uncharacterized protein n=1 Tax=Rhizodiscina lignyota TaxID=1504668 RepID=A0A9P4IN31_9PEZI|nr:hypothetical protein NA57DRAFT_64798 [Rhizodiscina lignyota]